MTDGSWRGPMSDDRLTQALDYANQGECDLGEVAELVHEVRTLRAKLEQAQAYAAERVAEQRAHAAAAMAETTATKAELAALRLVTPVGKTVEMHIHDTLADDEMAKLRDMTEALDMHEDSLLCWSDCVGAVRELRELNRRLEDEARASHEQVTS